MADRMLNLVKILKVPLLSGGCLIAGGVLGVAYERSKSRSVLPVVCATDLPLPSRLPAGSKPSRIVDIMKYGFPGLENVKSRKDYILSYNNRLRGANWVFEHLTADNLNRKIAERTKCYFVKDHDIHSFFQASNEDYRKSGYDRGHLAAAANHRDNQSAMEQTFLLSNISPQVGTGFNRDAWEGLEKHARKLARKNKNVYVVTGPLFLPRQEMDGRFFVKYEVIGKNRIAVPTHFFKVVLCESHNNQFEVQSFIMPNQAISEKTPLHRFHVPLETIEKASGLLLFDRIPRKAITETKTTL